MRRIAVKETDHLIVHKKRLREEQVWKFVRAKEPRNPAFFLFTKTDIKKVLFVLDGFKCEIRKISNEFYFIDRFCLHDYAKPEWEKYVLMKTDKMEEDSILSRTYIHNEVELDLYDYIVHSGSPYYSTELI